MNLLFVDCRPSQDLQKSLDQHLVQTSFVPELRLAKGHFEVVVWTLRMLADLRNLKQIRLRYPDSWIALVIPDEWLKDPQSYAAVLGASEKDDVWLQSTWESGFWLSLQRAVQSRALRDREQELLKELDAIKAEQDTLATASDALVQKLESDAALATEVHRKFYPRFSPDVPGVQVLSKYLPASGPGGDYFDIFEFGDRRHFGLLLADARSHKTAATLLSVLLASRLEDLRGRFDDSAGFVKHLNDAVQAQLPDAVATLSLTYAVFDRASLVLDITSAGGLPGRLWRQGALQKVEPALNPPLIRSGQQEWNPFRVQLQPGDTLLLHTDGLSSAIESGKVGFETTLQSLASQQSADPLDIRNRLLASVDASQTKEGLKDDLTLILLSVDPRALFVRPVTALRR